MKIFPKNDCMYVCIYVYVLYLFCEEDHAIISQKQK